MAPERADASAWADGHVFARIGGRFFSSDDVRWSGEPVVPWIAFEHVPVDPRVTAAAERMMARVSLQLRAMARECHLRRAPGWLDLEQPVERDGFDFPTWAVTRRPFDWAEDESDLPSPPPTPYPMGPRQLDLYLRPPAPVVQ